ncbi:MAG TPA: cytochrome C oxidase subunit IV family protein [Candidatus Eremiobacteraceae bacterium]|nr:cytochrome C oxidase subunit IV family protein [Candidatus Eremiobacteraceae bacterium]
MTEHVVSPKIYVVILLALLLGTYLTVTAALHDFGLWNIVIALAIATTKATLVVLFFMHAKYSPKRTQLVVACAVFWLALLLFMTMSDYFTRVDYRGIRYPVSQNVFIHQPHRS